MERLEDGGGAVDIHSYKLHTYVVQAGMHGTVQMTYLEPDFISTTIIIGALF
jgi:hypothetical protein